jgi:hypothetical protein
MSGDTEAFLAQPNAPHNVGLLATYPGMGFLKGMSTSEAFHAATSRIADNLTHLYESSPKTMQEVSPQWYIGGRRMVGSWADRWGVAPQSAAAATAVLSPSKDWFENASMAERTGDILFTKGKMPFSSAMADKAKELTSGGKNSDMKALLPSIKSKRLDDLETPEQKAAWIRLYDEAHNPSHFRMLAPDGGLGPFMVNADGVTRAKMAWQSNDNVAKSVKALESGGDMAKISPLLGQRHKVRNFYNNLTHPDQMIGVTADTHQVAAGLLMPLAGGDPAVLHNLLTNPKTPAAKAALGPDYQAAKGSGVTGFQGTYPVFEQGTKLAGENLGLLPHMAQSSTWEPVRQLFVNKSPQAKQAMANIWSSVDRGLLDPAAARDMIMKTAGGIREPWWMGKAGGLLHAPGLTKTY